MRSVYWALCVNVLAARRLRPAQRRALYRIAGLALGDARVASGCYFDSNRISIGSGCTIHENAFILNTVHVDIGPGVTIGPGVWIITSARDIGPTEARAGELHWRSVCVGTGAFIGANTLLMPGVKVGPRCSIGPGSVVVRNCTPDGRYEGVPARLVGVAAGDDGREP